MRLILVNTGSELSINLLSKNSESENVKYSFQHSKKFFILYRLDMKVTPMDSLCFSDENHTKCHVNRSNFT